MTTKESRGIRNNNPGNIEINPNNNWIGQIMPSKDPRFVTFSSPIYGIRALVRVLITYFDTHKLDTIEKIIGRWAPNNENNTESYILSVVNHANMPRNAPLDMFDYETVYAITEAIIKHENGKQPYSKKQIDKSLTMAGIQVPDATTMIVSNQEQAKKNNLDRSAIGITGLALVSEALGYVEVIAERYGTPLLICVVLGILLYNYRDSVLSYFKAKFDL